MKSILVEAGQLIRLPSRVELQSFVRIEDALPRDGGWRLYVATAANDVVRLDLTEEEAGRATILRQDGGADSAAVLAALWTEWMRAASIKAKSTILASSPLRPYAHQTNAVYGAMLPQPRLRFLLADEPGTGKTIMAGLYLREMQRLGFINRALIVVPAHLVVKWQGDFERFFGGGLRRITAQTITEGALQAPHDLWIVSLDLAAVNPAVQEAIRPDVAGWDAVVFDEAHRMTPTAANYYRVGSLLASRTPRALFMTATPHRGKEWLFRALMHLVDHEVYPSVDAGDESVVPIKPARLHFLRRMKEKLVDYDGVTKLFKGRHATNVSVPLNGVESAYYAEALELVDRYFPPGAIPLAKLVYGKRAASSLWALRETLRRRRAAMGTQAPAAAAMEADLSDDDRSDANEARVIVEASLSARAERADIDALLKRLDALFRDPQMPISKWTPLSETCFAANGIAPGNGEQAVVFTEYADTADWLKDRLRAHGFSAERYSGRDDHATRESIRERFARLAFQVLVSTDAGNEGIDLQTAHVLVNYDIPWSLVQLEQRMGRIHRVGQTRDVELMNLIATDTREGEVLQVLMDNFVTAANRLDGKLFDSLSLVADLMNLNFQELLANTYADERKRREAIAAAKAVTASGLEALSREADAIEAELASNVDVSAAIAALHEDQLDRINPAIVTAYLTRLTRAAVISIAPHGAGDGIFALTRPRGLSLPPQFDAAQRSSDASARRNGDPKEVVIATSGAALAAARGAGADMADAVSLGPAEPAFRSLVDLASGELGPFLFQGGVVRDASSVTDYDLFCFAGRVSEADNRRQATWSALIRVDALGARAVRWEALANLESAYDLPSRMPHPSRIHDARETATRLAREEQQRRSATYEEWLKNAEHELSRLPDVMSRNLNPRDRRIAERRRLEQMVKDRLADLRAMAAVSITDVREVGWVGVVAAGSPIEPKQADSEMIAMRAATEFLRSDGWAVADVHTEGRGYDLHASRGRAQRCVEVKGVWMKASSDGVSLTGDEVLIASQLASEYWLYVFDGCSDGRGTLYAAYQDPVKIFGGLMKDVSVVRVPGSALKAARERGDGICA
jgi:superfamily II DNA or RNA helicase